MSDTTDGQHDEAPRPVAFAEALRVWARIGLLGFGGPAGQIALMHEELVVRRRWIGEARFLHALNYCMLLPGPEAQQLAVYVGWLMNGIAGGVAAGVLFVLPGAMTILALSIAYATWHQLPLVAALFFGLKAAVLAIVVEAVLRIARRALRTRVAVVLAALAFVALFFFAVPFPLVILAAAVTGLVASRVTPAALPSTSASRDASEQEPPALIDSLFQRGLMPHAQPSARRAAKVLATCLALWACPVLLALALGGRDGVHSQQGIFFSKLAVVTFGGAYAVLAYVAQSAVHVHGWLSPREMLDGLGLAETTPGPLILVLQFVAFLGAYRQPGVLPPLVSGTLGALLATWVTFVPCFLWIFLGGPYIEAVRASRSLAAALSAITAAVVGVVANLSVWFAMHVLFARVGEARFGPVHLLVPEWRSLDGAALALSALACVLTFRFKLGMPKTLAACAALGLAWKLLAG